MTFGESGHDVRGMAMTFGGAAWAERVSTTQPRSDAMSGASTKTSSTQSNTVDPTQMARFTQNYDTALGVANRPFQPYAGEMVAGSNPALDQGYAMLGNIANA